MQYSGLHTRKYFKKVFFCFNINMNFNQLGQGKGFLELRKYLKKNVLEGFRSFSGPSDEFGPGGSNTGPVSYSNCAMTKMGSPRYGWCPVGTDDLLYKKDDDPTESAAQIDNLNSLMSQQQSLYKVYINDVNQYIANPNQSPVGRNIIVPRLTGGAPSCASCAAYDKAKAECASRSSGTWDSTGGTCMSPNGEKCTPGGCPYMYGSYTKSYQQTICAAACCTFEDHEGGNTCT